MSTLLLEMLRWICQPLVRLLVAKGVTYPQFAEVLKQLYVESASNYLAERNEKPTLSRIFVQTGIHRKEVKRLLEREPSNENPVSNASATIGSLLVSRWLGQAEFTHKNGKPRRLPKVANDDGAGFNELVSVVSKDIHPKTVLAELLTMGVVSLDNEDRVCLNTNAFVPTADLEGKIFFFGRNLRDHVDTCVYNILSNRSPRFERSVYYTLLSQSSVLKLQELANEKATEALEFLNREALRLKQKDKDSPDAKFRIRYGSYWYDNINNTDSRE